MTDNKTRLRLIIFAISLLTLHVGISDVNAISPFDQFIPLKSNETSNQSSQDPFEKELPGEHGHSQDED